MNLQQRKPQRLKHYDYNQNNAYFISICTQHKLHLFGEVIDHTIMLNHAGKMVTENLLNLSNLDGIAIDKYTVMPNHIHAIIAMQNDGTTQGSFSTVSKLVQRYKSTTTKLYIDGVHSGIYPPFDRKIWQKSFYDHIIRNEDDYLRIWQYIDENPTKWADDEYNVLIYSN